jgi:cellulose synthase/poly-beta-1,6-N-acetylglucosamine synthase-like glycosyltransferase
MKSGKNQLSFLQNSKKQNKLSIKLSTKVELGENISCVRWELPTTHKIKYKACLYSVLKKSPPALSLRMRPKVSLILTIHNRSPYLPQAIASIQTQAYLNYELILWNDGSTDDSGEIAAHHAAQDPRIRHFTAKHQGRNAALRAAHQQA